MAGCTAGLRGELVHLNRRTLLGGLAVLPFAAAPIEQPSRFELS